MIESVVLSVSGMKCGGCESNVTAKLSAVEGVKVVKASSKDKQVGVEYDADKTSLEAIKALIQAAGYAVQ
jgi:copper chaperone CopZ